MLARLVLVGLPSACGREAIIHLRVNYKREQMVHIFNYIRKLNTGTKNIQSSHRRISNTLSLTSN